MVDMIDVVQSVARPDCMYTDAGFFRHRYAYERRSLDFQLSGSGDCNVSLVFDSN